MKKFELINCATSTNPFNETVYLITYSFIDEWNEKQTCCASCYVNTDASTNNLYLRTQVFRIKDKNGKWNARFAKHLIYTDIYNKNVSKHINFLKRILAK